MYIDELPLPASIPHAHYDQKRIAIRDDSNATALPAETSSTRTSSSDAPFFTSGSSGNGSSSDVNGGQSNVTKSVLEWVIAIVILLAVITLCTLRYSQVKRRNQSMHHFIPRPKARRSDSRDHMLNTRELPRTTGLPRARTLSGASLPVGESLFYPPSLVHGRYPQPLEPQPAHLAHSASIPGIDRGRRGRRAVRGTDIDALGRRGGQPDADDWDGDQKDELPAYESVAVGGPPRYSDTDAQYVDDHALRVLTMHDSVYESNRESRATERTSRRDESTDQSRPSSPTRADM